MNRLKLTSAILLCILTLCSCNSIEDTTLEISEDTTTTIETSDNTSSEEDTSITSDSTSSEKDTSTTSDSTSSEEDTSTTSDSTSSEEDTSTISDITSSEENTSIDTTEETTQANETSNYNDLIIPINSTSEHITFDMCKEISEYFNSMICVDTTTFQSKQLSAYNSFMDEYLAENQSDLDSMLSTYCDNFLKSNGDETIEYSDFSFNSITLNYPNDVDSILNTMNYINQLDEVTQQYEDYTLSDKLTAYYQLNYTIDYTLNGEGLESLNLSKDGSILVLDINGELSMIMLY